MVFKSVIDEEILIFIVQFVHFKLMCDDCLLPSGMWCWSGPAWSCTQPEDKKFLKGWKSLI